jgi:hypothetical protein
MNNWTDDRWEIEAGVVRPYLLTRGRTRNADRDLAVETMVETTPMGKEMAHRLKTEQRNIIELCFNAQSLAEISAKLRAPLGVVRVLVGDLVADNLVHAHNALSGAARADTTEEIDLLERLITRVKAIPV